jgi:hypothetical protein
MQVSKFTFNLSCNFEKFIACVLFILFRHSTYHLCHSCYPAVHCVNQSTLIRHMHIVFNLLKLSTWYVPKSHHCNITTLFIEMWFPSCGAKWREYGSLQTLQLIIICSLDNVQEWRHMGLCICVYDFRTSGHIFMKLGMNIMALEAALNSYLYFPALLA